MRSKTPQAQVEVRGTETLVSTREDYCRTRLVNAINSKEEKLGTQTILRKRTCHFPPDKLVAARSLASCGVSELVSGR